MAHVAENIVESARLGHNFMILGQAGTGKSTLLKRIKEELRGIGKNVVMTASTGIAASLISGRTLHSWAKLGDGRLTASQIVSKMEIEEVNAINHADVLIIDEISMLSADTFEKTEMVIRRTRKSALTFGGLQVIVCGDLLQVPLHSTCHLDFYGALLI